MPAGALTAAIFPSPGSERQWTPACRRPDWDSRAGPALRIHRSGREGQVSTAPQAARTPRQSVP